MPQVTAGALTRLLGSSWWRSDGDDKRGKVAVAHV
jgi:hypothetical protein